MQVEIMCSLNDIESSLSNQLKDFYELNDIEKQKALQTLLEFANNDPNLFMALVRRSQFDELNNLPIFYEALSKDLNKWSDFFINEAKRLFNLAKTSSEPKKVLTHLDEFSFIDAENFKHRNEFLDLLIKHLDNKNPTFRYYSVSLLPDFIKEGDTEALRKLRRHLTDKDWRIRYQTYSALKDLNRLASNENLSWFDSIRARFLNPFKFK